MGGHRVQNKYTINFGKKIEEAMRNAKASHSGRGVTEGDGEGKPGTKEPPRSDRQALCRSDTIAVQSCLAAALPSQSGLRPPAPPKGEPLAGRATSYCLPEARIWRKRAGLATEGSSF